jgi:tRNA (mo5U34)-methyltransferase
VVAVDYVVWAAGTNPEGRPVTEVPLPGRRGFDLARETLGSGVEPVVADFEKTGLRELGSFDVVLYLGVLYHMENPLHALRELAAVTGGLAIVETQAICVPGLEHEAIWQFFPADELNHDPSNWWVPNLSGLGGALTAAGFDRVTTMVGPSPELLAHEGGGPHHYRAVVHACKDAASPR